jgi:hypothetical protein
MPRPDVLEKLVSLCKRRGFILQSSEIYGGTGSVWDYGPLGVEWMQSTADARTIEALPKAARAYLDRIEELVESPIRYVSVGTRRDQIIGL